MSELFVDNSSMSVGESRDVAPFASGAFADSLRRGVAAAGSRVVLGSFVPLNFGEKKPKWREMGVRVDADEMVIREGLPSHPSVEAAAGDGEFLVTSHGLVDLDLDFHDQASGTQRMSDRGAFLSLMRGLTGAARVYVSRTGSGGGHAPLLVPERLYDEFPLLWFVFGRVVYANSAHKAVGGRVLRAFAAEINDSVAAVVAERVDVSAGDKRIGVRADGTRDTVDGVSVRDPRVRYRVIVPDNVLCGVSEGAAYSALSEYTAAYARGDGEAMARAAGVFPAVGVLSDVAARRLSELVLRELLVPGVSLSDADATIAAREGVLEALPGAVRALAVSGRATTKCAPWGLPLVSENVLRRRMCSAVSRAYALVNEGAVEGRPSDLVAAVEGARFALCDGFLNPLVWGEYAGEVLTPAQRAVLVRGGLRLSGVGELWELVRSVVDPAASFLSDEALDEASADSVVMAAAEAWFPVLGGQRGVDAVSGSDGVSREKTLALSCAESESHASVGKRESFKSRRYRVAGRGVGVVDALGVVRVAESLGLFNDTSGRDLFTFGNKWADAVGCLTRAGSKDGVDFARSWRFCTVTFAEAMAEGLVPFVDRVAWMLSNMGTSGAIISYAVPDVLEAHRVLAETAEGRGGDPVFDGDPTLVESAHRLTAGKAARVSRVFPGVRVEGADGVVVAVADEDAAAGKGAQGVRTVRVSQLSPRVVEAVYERLSREGDVDAVHALVVGWSLALRRVLSRLFASDTERSVSAVFAGAGAADDSASSAAGNPRSVFAGLGARGEAGVLDIERAVKRAWAYLEERERGLQRRSARTRENLARAKRDVATVLAYLWMLSVQGATWRLSGSRERLRALLRDAARAAGDTRGATQCDNAVNERVKRAWRLLRGVGVLSFDEKQRAPIAGAGGRSSVYSIRIEFLRRDVNTLRAVEALRTTVVPMLSGKFSQGCALNPSVGVDALVRFGGRTLDEWDTLGGPWRERVAGNEAAGRVADGERVFAARDRAVLDRLVGEFSRAVGIANAGGASAVGVARAAARAAAVSGRELFANQVAICELARLAAEGVEGVRVVAGIPTPHMVMSSPSKAGAQRLVEVVRRDVAREAWDGATPGTPEYAKRTDEVFGNRAMTPSHLLRDGGVSAKKRELFIPVFVLVAEGSPLLLDERFARVMCQSFPESGESGISLFVPVSLVDAGGAAAWVTCGGRGRLWFEAFAGAAACAINGGVESGVSLIRQVRGLLAGLCEAKDYLPAFDGGHLLAASGGVLADVLAGVRSDVVGAAERALLLAAVGLGEARPGAGVFLTDYARGRLAGMSEGELAVFAGERLASLSGLVDSIAADAAAVPAGVDVGEWAARLAAAVLAVWGHVETSRRARANGGLVCALVMRVLAGVSAASTGGGVGVVPKPDGWVLRA
jgi:hypothetical protein